jgi:hypothetical protein
MAEHAVAIKMQSQNTKTESEKSPLQQTKEHKGATISLLKNKVVWAVMPLALRRESNVSEEHVVSSFNVSQRRNYQINLARRLFLLVSYLAYSFTSLSETSGCLQTMWRYTDMRLPYYLIAHI